MLHILQNQHWQTGILPAAGGSIAFGRMRYAGTWVDILRPTAEADYGSASKCSSFLMLPWANRIRDGVLRFRGEQYQLQISKDDQTARHGDVRGRAWTVISSSPTAIRLHFDSREHAAFNFPFALSVQLEYGLDGRAFIWRVTLKNEDSRPFPAGFGHHPYFLIPQEQTLQLQVPCRKHFELVGAMASAAAVDLPSALDFQAARPLTADMGLEYLYTARQHSEPVRLIYPRWNTAVEMHMDDIFQQVLVFSAPDGTVAIEPQTNANDGFNLYANGIEGSGVFVVEPGASVSGTIQLVQTGNI